MKASFILNTYLISSDFEWSFRKNDHLYHFSSIIVCKKKTKLKSSNSKREQN